MIAGLLGLLFPDKCLLCGKVLGKGELDLCGECRQETGEYASDGRTLPNISAMTALWAYDGVVRAAIMQYKFYGKRSLAEGFGRQLAMRVLRQLPQADVIVGVPLSQKRQRERGYDQVALLCMALSRELGIPHIAALEKHRDNRANSSLESAKERWENVRGVYRVKNAQAVAGKRVLLVDDVITTGATMVECARMLREAGAAEVVCAAIAAGKNRKQSG